MGRTTRILISMLVTISMVIVPLGSTVSQTGHDGGPRADDGPSSRAADFSLSLVGLSTVMTGQGANMWWIVEANSIDGFEAQIDFSVSGLPGFTNHYFYPSNVTPPANGTASTFFRINTTDSTPANWYVVTVTGTSGALTDSININMGITNGAFANAEITPFEVHGAPGDTVNVSLLIISMKGCSGATQYWKGGDDGLGSTMTFDPASPSNLVANTIKLITISVGIPGGASPGEYNHLAWLMPACVMGSNGFGAGFKVHVHGANSYSLQGRPWIQSVASGEATTFSFDVRSYGTFNSDVDLDVGSILPDGVTVEFNPSTVTPDAGEKNTSTLTVQTSESTPSGIYPITGNGTSGATKTNSTVYLWVTNEPDFSITGSPSSHFVTPGNSVSYKVMLSSLKGFSDTVNMTLLSPPAGATLTFSSKSVDIEEDDIVDIDLNVTAGGAMALDTYVIRVQANNTTLLHYVDLILKVVNTLPSDFNITVTPASVKASAFKGYDYEADLGSLNSFSGTVDLSVEGVPNGTTSKFNTSSVDVPADGSILAKLTITPSASTPIGSFILTIVGESGAKVHDAKVLFRMTEIPGVVITPDPDPVPILKGSFALVTLTLNTTTGFVGDIDFSGVTLPAGFSASFDPTSVAVNGTTIMNLSVDGTVSVGDHLLDIEGAALVDLFTCELTVRVQDYSLSSADTVLEALPGGNVIYTVDVSGGNGYTGQVDITVEGLPANVTMNVTDTPVTVPDQVSIELTIEDVVAPGSYPFDVKGYSQSLERDLTLTLNVTDFDIIIDPMSVGVLPGFDTMLTVDVLSIEGFNGTVDLASSAPVGLTSALTDNSILAPGQTTLQVNSLVDASRGDYNVTVTGTYLDFERRVTAVVTVQDYTLDVDPPLAMVGKGETAVYTVSVMGIEGFDGDVDLSILGKPADTSVSLDPVTIAPSETSTMTIEVSTGATLGNHSLTLRGVNGTYSITTTFNLAISDISLVADPTTLTLLVGENGTSTISIADPTGAPAPVGLEVKDGPLDGDMVLTPATIQPDGSSTLTIDTTNMLFGNYTVTIGVVGAGDKGSVSIDLVVQDFTIVIDTAKVSISAGQSASVMVGIVAENGFDQEVGLSIVTPKIANFPGVALAPEAISPGEEAELIVLAIDSTVLGEHIASIISTSPAERRTDLTIEVTATPLSGFDMTVSPAKVTVKAGKDARYKVTLTVIGTFSDTVELSVLGLPDRSTANWSVQVTSVPAEVTLTIETSKETELGEFNLTITGRGGSSLESEDVVLVVQKAKEPGKHDVQADLFSFLPYILLIVIICVVFAIVAAYMRKKQSQTPPMEGTGPEASYQPVQGPGTEPAQAPPITEEIPPQTPPPVEPPQPSTTVPPPQAPPGPEPQPPVTQGPQ